MALSAGERLGPYQIIGKIGQGGMGEVYRATDTKLGRDVAIKILPAGLARDPERLARFEREARVLAALNHPNIATIYGLEETEGNARAIVMELVEGPTLADRLRAGPLELKEALAIALAIADALEAAHDKGVVHRDLKPANVKAPQDGPVKVLDLGLATALPGSEREPGEGENSPTLTMGATQAGVIMGTAAYMSPEQASGKRVDKRADIWSFGVVLWEMLTRKRLFEGGETVSHTLADVLRAEIDFEKVDAPAPIKELLKRCLDRNVRTRLRDIGEARIILNSAVHGDLLKTPSESRAIAPPLGKPFWAVSVLAILFAAVMLWFWLRPRPPETKPVIRFSFAVPAFNPAAGLTLSSDGSMVAYQTYSGKPVSVRRIDQFEAQPVPGTDGVADVPCFSPANQWIAFKADGGKRIKKMRLSGGGALTLAEGLNQINGCDWGEDGYIYFGGTSGIMRVPDSGGKAEIVAQPDPKKNEAVFSSPQLLPGAKLLLFNSSAQLGPGDQSVMVLNLQTHERKTVLEKVGATRYAPTAAGSGHLVYWRNGTLFGVPFDLRHLTAGSPSPVAEGVSGLATFGFLNFSDSGTLAYQPGGLNVVSNNVSVPVWVDRQGVEQAIPGLPPRIYASSWTGGIQLSPDGKQAALSYLDPEAFTSDIWLYDFARKTFIKNTFGGGHQAVVWSASGKSLMYWAASGPIAVRGEMKSASADGSGQPETLLANENAILLPGSVSPDGKTLLGDQVKILLDPGYTFALPLQGSDRKPKLLFGEQFNQHGAMFSPDGHWIAYTSNESGSDQVYVVSFPGLEDKRQVSNNGGAFPRWNRTGRELFYREGTKLMAVDVELGAAFRPGTPRMLFDKPYLGNYDVAPDGKRFLMFKNAASAQGQATELRVVVNWFEELRQRAPAR